MGQRDRVAGVLQLTENLLIGEHLAGDALTVAERKVVALVAQRLSNPEIAEPMFVSRRTVETHVSHALRKLGLSSRLELATEAARRGDPG